MSKALQALAEKVVQLPFMKTNLSQARLFCALALGIGSSFSLAAAAGREVGSVERGASEDMERKSVERGALVRRSDALTLYAPLTAEAARLAWSQIGANAGADYQGDGLGVSPTAEGARLRCVFQRLEGEASREGLWLTSTVTNAVNDRFRIVAAAVGREVGDVERGASENVERESVERGVLVRRSDALTLDAPLSPHAPRSHALADAGTLVIDGQSVRFTRPGLTEEYSVSMDGVRQDFVIEQRPIGAGPLRVELDVTGARVEPLVDGGRLVLENSGRKIAYSRLRVTDATGKELTARMEVSDGRDAFHRVPIVPGEDQGRGGTHPYLVVVVNDAEAVYPVRIDPTFSDANWISMNPSIPGAGGTVNAAMVDGSGNLYIGGYFTAVGDVVANYIAKWNGTNWSALGSGMNGGVGALAVSGSNVYAAGYFTTAGGSAANYIAKWDGSAWSALGSGISLPPDYPFYGGGVYALAVSGSNVYAGGSFTNAGGRAANNIARWDGSSWTALGSGTDRIVYALAVSGSDVYAGGYFTNAGGSAANNIAKWDGSSWTALGSGISGGVNALALSGTDLYAGGGFTVAGGSAANSIAKWDGSTWTALGSGMGLNSSVYALAVSRSDLYAGGFFTVAGGSTANSIAKWDGSSWTALGSGMNGSVLALAVSGSDLYAGGYFTTAGGAATNIAKWDGSNWSALGSGMGGDYPYVRALAVSGSDLYAGGDFTAAGGNTANYIAKWNGSSWSALGSGMGGDNADFSLRVHALAVSGSDLYAGGNFTTAGGGPATNIAKWDGSSWSALGSGMDYEVSALAVSGGDLYAGGYFTTAGGSAANSIAKWNGSSWTALGSGIDNVVHALAVSGSNVYAGGLFWTAGGSAANNIAKWNGSSWSALGSGMNSYVFALAVSGSDLYAGGDFATAGGKVSPYIARAYLPTLPTLSVLRSGANVMVSWPSVDTASFALEQAGTLAAPVTWVTNAASITDDGTNKSVSIPATNSAQFFRLRR